MALTRGKMVAVNGGVKFPPPVRNSVATKIFRIEGSTGANITHSLLTYSEGPFTGGEIIVANGLSTAVVIDGAMIAPSASPNDEYNPLDGSGAAQAWTTIAGGPWTIPPAQVAGYQAGVYGIGKIPFTCSSIPRTDVVGAPPLAMVRLHFSTTHSVGFPATTEMDAISTISSAARKQSGYWKGQNQAQFLTPSNFTTPTRQMICPISVKFFTTVASYMFLGLGDSTNQGCNGTPSTFWPGLARACAALTTLAKPIAFVNGAFAGQTIPQTLAQADGLIKAFSPHFVSIPFWSPNSPPSDTASASAILAQVLSLAAKCKRSGITPVLTVPNPNDGIAAGTDNIRKAMIASVRLSGFQMFEAGTVVGNGATPERYITGTVDDGTHANETGLNNQDTLAFRPKVTTLVGP